MIIICAIIIYLIRRQKKVCFKIQHARFPFYTTQRLSARLARSQHVYDAPKNSDQSDSSTVDNFTTKPTPSIDYLEPEKTYGTGQMISKQLLTDGHERAVHFNYKVTLYGYDPTNGVNSKEKQDANDVFMI